MLSMIKSIYHIVLSCVRFPYGKTFLFDCPNGVKQSCISSPILFSLLVQEITNDIHRCGGYGIQLFLTWLRLVFCCLRTTSYLLLYGSELWGLNVMSVIENVHLFSLKKLLQVPIFTPNVIVYGDSGRYELRIHAVLRSIKYWIRILNMKDSRNVCKVYNMMRYDGNYQNWCGKTKELLIHFNFEDVWDLWWDGVPLAPRVPVSDRRSL